MNIEQLPLTKLQAAPYNPRVALTPGMDGYERLARSLEEFALVQPLVWNRRTGHLVGGHQRKAILEAKGCESAPCVVVDLDADREKALNVALNNDRVGGDWEPDRLLDVLEDLTRSDIDPTLTGFSDDDLQELLLDADEAFEPLPEPEREHVVATLEIVPDDWPEAQTWVDSLLAALPRTRVHVEESPVARDQSPVARDQSPVARDQSPVAGD